MNQINNRKKKVAKPQTRELRSAEPPRVNSMMRNKTILLLLMVITPYIFSTACNNPLKQDNVSTSGEKVDSVKTDTTPIESHVAIAPLHKKDSIVGNWTYKSSIDEMSGYHNLTAALQLPYDSDPEVKYAHNNPSTGASTEDVSFEIILKKQGRRQIAILSVGRYSNTTMPPIEGNRVLIRFDQGRPSYYHVVKSREFERTGDLFIEPVQKFINNIKKARVMRMQVKLKGEESQIAHIYVAGLKF